MPLVSMKKILDDAQKGKYAVGAFNVENLEMAMAVVSAAEELKSPVIIATSVSALKYAPPKVYCGMINSLCEKLSIEVALHLDHGDSFEIAMETLQAGYTSVMYDGSKMSYNENVMMSRKISDICHVFGVPVEGELGAIVGKKDDEINSRKMILTRPEMAEDYVERSGVDFLAVAIGTCHGLYKEAPRLDYERLAKIHEVVDTPLVLHGASGLSEKQLRRCIEGGITKINFATELRQAYSQAIYNQLINDRTIIDPKVYGREAMEAVKEVVKNRMEILGSINKM